jgi:hypothetical protein
MPYCPRCGKSVAPEDTFCPSCGYNFKAKTAAVVVPAVLQEQPPAEPAPKASPVQKLARLEDRVLDLVPRFGALDFWLLISALLLLYDGISEVVLQYGPGLPFAIGAVLAGLLYVFFARTYHLGRGEGWILQASVGIPALVVIGDFIVTGVFTSLSALLVMVNFVIIYTALKELQDKAAPPEQ